MPRFSFFFLNKIGYGGILIDKAQTILTTDFEAINKVIWLG